MLPAWLSKLVWGNPSNKEVVAFDGTTNKAGFASLSTLLIASAASAEEEAARIAEGYIFIYRTDLAIPPIANPVIENFDALSDGPLGSPWVVGTNNVGTPPEITIISAGLPVDMSVKCLQVSVVGDGAGTMKFVYLTPVAPIIKGWIEYQLYMPTTDYDIIVAGLQGEISHPALASTARIGSIIISGGLLYTYVGNPAPTGIELCTIGGSSIAHTVGTTKTYKFGFDFTTPGTPIYSIWVDGVQATLPVDYTFNESDTPWVSVQEFVMLFVGAPATAQNYFIDNVSYYKEL